MWRDLPINLGLPAAGRDVTAVDSKTPWRSCDRARQQSALHLARAFAAHSRLILGQVAVEAKSNESMALPALLDMLSHGISD